MSAAQDLFNGILKSVTQQAGAAVASSAPVKEAVIAAQEKYEKVEKLAWAGVASWAVVFAFYYLPRFELPIPRVLRRGRR